MITIHAQVARRIRNAMRTPMADFIKCIESAKLNVAIAGTSTSTEAAPDIGNYCTLARVVLDADYRSEQTPPGQIEL